MSRNSADDNPWGRLVWTLPTAVLIWAAVLSGFAYFTEKPARQPEELPPIDAMLIEQPAQRPAAVHKTRQLPVKRQKAPVLPHSNPGTSQNTAATPVTLPAAAAPVGAQATAGGKQPLSEGSSSPNNGARSGSNEGKGPGNMSANSGARAIIRPMPQIPDDLREEAFNFVASARFHISVDGSATVELAKSTPDPRLNKILLDSLRKWRFIPAIKNGKPVASTEEINVRLEVK